MRALDAILPAVRLGIQIAELSRRVAKERRRRRRHLDGGGLTRDAMADVAPGENERRH